MSDNNHYGGAHLLLAFIAGGVAGAAVALLAPEQVLWMRPGLEPAFAVTMLCVGTLVRPEQVRAFLAAPLCALAGLIGQYTIMPLCAWAVSLAFSDPVLRTGIVHPVHPAGLFILVAILLFGGASIKPFIAVLLVGSLLSSLGVPFLTHLFASL